MAEDLALEAPHLDPRDAISGVGSRVSIIVVAVTRVHLTTAHAVPFGARGLGAAETDGAGDPDAFGAEAQRRLHRALHRAAEGDAALELVGDALGDELRVDFRLADFDDVEAHFARGHLLQLALQFLDVRALLADDHAGAPGIDADPTNLRWTLDHHLRNRRLRQLFDDVAADLEIFEQQPAVVMPFGEPTAVPRAVDLQAQPDRRGFLTHYASSCSRTTTRI